MFTQRGETGEIRTCPLSELIILGRGGGGGGRLCESVKLLDKSGPRQNYESDRDCLLPAGLWAWALSSSSRVHSLPQLSHSAACHPLWCLEETENASPPRRCAFLNRHQNCKLKDISAWKWPAGQGSLYSGSAWSPPFCYREEGYMVQEAKTSRARRMAHSFPSPPALRSCVARHSSIPSWNYIVIPAFRDPFVNFQRAVVAAADPLDLHFRLFFGEHRNQRAEWPLPMLPVNGSLYKTLTELF